MPLDVGGKVSGRIGRFELGTLAVQQEAYENPYVAGETIDATTAFVGRVAANVLEESSVGMIVTTATRPRTSTTAWSASISAIRTASSSAANRSRGTPGSSKSDSENLVGDDTALGFAVRMPSNTGLRGERRL